VDWLEGGKSYRLELVGREGGTDVLMLAEGDLLNVEVASSPGGAAREAACPNCNEAGLPTHPLMPPPEAFTRIASFFTSFVAAEDPNEKSVPDGEGDEEFVGIGAELYYTIYFENIVGPHAANAQRVVIFDQLHPYHDASTVELLDVSVGGRIYPLYYFGPDRSTGYMVAPSVTLSSASVSQGDLYASEPCSGDQFSVSAHVDRFGGTITWTFETRGCDGQLVPPDTDPGRGFLPPNRTPPAGEGFVSFTVGLDPNIPDDAPIFNRAEIRFDDELKIVTNTARNVFSLFLLADEPANPVPRPYEPELDNRVRLDTSLSWAACRHAKRYDVYFWEPDATEPIVIRDLTAPRASVPIPLGNDTLYRWQVVAKNVKGAETRGPEWSFKTTPPCPEQPIELTVTNDGCPYRGPITLRWEAVPSATAYAVRFRRCSEPWEYRGAGGAGVELVLDNLRPGAYEWQVTAMSEACPKPDWEEAATGHFEACAIDPFVRGDTDASGVVNLTDAVAVLLYLFSGGREPACFDAADSDDNGQLQLTDAVRILGWLFLGGTSPSHPSPSVGDYPTCDCGVDPVTDPPDPLGCAAFGPCE